MQHEFDRQRDQRQGQRQVAKVRVLFFSKGEPRAVDAECQNISLDGLFVKTRRRGPDAGTRVSLLLTFEGAGQELMVDGIVRWQGAVRSLDDGSEGAGMGIQFVDMEPKIRDLLEEALSRLGAGSGH
jgi:Tfp pilus assembly protein PilZ